MLLNFILRFMFIADVQEINKFNLYLPFIELLVLNYLYNLCKQKKKSLEHAVTLFTITLSVDAITINRLRDITN